MDKSTVRKQAAALAAVVLVAGCASQDKPIGYGWHGQPGLAAATFGGSDGAQAAFKQDSASCDSDAEKQAQAAPYSPAAQGGLVGAIIERDRYTDQRESLFQRCMAARGWLPVSREK